MLVRSIDGMLVGWIAVVQRQSAHASAILGYGFRIVGNLDKFAVLSVAVNFRVTFPLLTS